MLLCPRDFPGKNTGVGFHFLLQGIFLTQESNVCFLYLLHWRQILYQGVIRASLVAQLVKNPPGMWETWVQSLGWEDPVEKGKATHYSILAWRIP